MPNHISAIELDHTPAKMAGEFLIGGDLRVTRLGFGAMRITEMEFGASLRIGPKPSAFCGALSNWESIS